MPDASYPGYGKYGYKKYFAQRKIGVKIILPTFLLIRNCKMFSVLRSPFSVLLAVCLMLGGCATLGDYVTADELLDLYIQTQIP
jgi:hypothetical protein